EAAVLAHRREVYERARRRRPERWTGPTRNWAPAGAVRLTPDRTSRPTSAAA
ncbi:MAG: IS3 family transposase, partial [Myxococcaceae bacterium]